MGRSRKREKTETLTKTYANKEAKIFQEREGGGKTGLSFCRPQPNPPTTTTTHKTQDTTNTTNPTALPFSPSTSHFLFFDFFQAGRTLAWFSLWMFRCGSGCQIKAQAAARVGRSGTSEEGAGRTPSCLAKEILC